MNTAIDRALAALNAHDVDALVACYAPLATIEDGDDGQLASGQLEIRNRYGPMFKNYPAIHVEPLGEFKAGSFVVQAERVTGRGAEPEQHIAIYKLENELITRERLLR